MVKQDFQPRIALLDALKAFESTGLSDESHQYADKFAEEEKVFSSNSHFSRRCPENGLSLAEKIMMKIKFSVKRILI